MKKPKRLGILLSLALTFVPAFAQDRVDLIVLLDSSQSMFQYYNQVVDYVLSQTVREYMRFGDAFHLLSFSDSTQVEIAKVLKTEEDLRSVIARLYLLYPLGRNTDLVTAIKNVYQYVADLPEGSAKRIILISDGMHSPAPGTPYAALEPTGVRAEIDRTAARIRERGWTMRVVRVPFDGVAGSEAGAAGSAGVAGGTATGPGAAAVAGDSASAALAGRGGEAAPSAPGSGDYLADVAAAVGSSVQTFDPANASASVNDSIDLPGIRFPSDLGKRGYAFTLPVELTNRSSRPLSIELGGLLLEDGTDILAKKAFAEIQPGKSARINLSVVLPDSIAEGPARLSVEPRFLDGIRASPARSVLTVELKHSFFETLVRNSVRVALFALLLVLAVGAVIVVGLYVRKAHRRAEQPIVDALIDSAAPGHASPSTQQARAALAAAPKTAAASGGYGTHGQLPAAEHPAAGQKSVAHEGTAAQALLASARGTSHARADLNQGTVQARDSALVRAGVLESARSAVTAPRHVLESSATGRRDNAHASKLLGAWEKPRASRVLLPSSAESASTLPRIKREPMHYSSRVVRPGAMRITLKVLGQNPNIGMRNVRTLHSGGRASVGGTYSDFLVFLLPVPRRLAYLHYDGEDATLVPLKPEFFPDYDSPIESCLGKDIRLVTQKGKELVLRFDRYVAPLDRINKLLHCLETPGMVLPTALIVGSPEAALAGSPESSETLDRAD